MRLCGPKTGPCRAHRADCNFAWQRGRRAPPCLSYRSTHLGVADWNQQGQQTGPSTRLCSRCHWKSSVYAQIQWRTCTQRALRDGWGNQNMAASALLVVARPTFVNALFSVQISHQASRKLIRQFFSSKQQWLIFYTRAQNFLQSKLLKTN